MVLDEACERRVRGDATSNRRAAREMRFDTRPTRVVGLFAKSKLKSYYSELTKVTVVNKTQDCVLTSKIEGRRGSPFLELR